MRSALKLALGLGLGGLFLWLTLRQVDLAAMLAAGWQVSPPVLALAPLCLAIGYACRIHRWRMMLIHHNPGLSFARVGVPFVASIAVNNLAPFRLGDVLRCFGFARWLNLSPSIVIATVLVERLLDLTALILALALALWLFSVEGAALGLGGSSALILATMGAVSILLLLNPGILSPLAAAAGRLAGHLGGAVRSRAEGALGPVIEGLTGLSRQRVLLRLVAWSLPVWLFEGAAFWVVALSMPLLEAPLAAWLAMPSGTLATLLPSTPGHVGTFDFFTQAAMAAAGNALPAATAFALIVHAMLWLTTTLTGGVCLLIWALTRNRAERA